MQIGLTLSGGGFRATVFHLGVLDRLAAQDLLEQVTFISTVSGGSLCAGLVYTANAYRWPSSLEFRQKVLPNARRLLTETDLQNSLIVRALNTFGLTRSRAPDLAKILKGFWEIRASLQELSPHPRWIINATCYETGKNWRFERKRMGDYAFGYELQPDFPIADAMAASAAYPGLIGPLTLHIDGRKWVRYTSSTQSEDTIEPITPQFKEVHLWDGGVYDNLGIEPLFKLRGGYREGVDFLVVSDASGLQAITPYRAAFFWEQGYRLVGIAMDQVRSLRARSLIDYFNRPNRDGCYLRIGNTGGKILRNAGREVELSAVAERFMPEAKVKLAAQMETHIRRLSPTEFDLLYQHGFEVANATLYAYIPQRFGLLPDTEVNS